MTVVVDNNLPRSLAHRLTAAGVQAVHVIDVGLDAADDEAVRGRFAHEAIIFLSRDGDFWSHHPREWAVVWIALHNPTLAQLRGPICLHLVRLIPALRPGQRVLLAADQVRIFGTL